MTEYNHKEAYCLMRYRCLCGHCETIWNSRDGVTPYSMDCPSCGSQLGLKHVNFRDDLRRLGHKPHPGQRVFVDMTEEDVERWIRRAVKEYPPKDWPGQLREYESMLRE